MKLQAGDVFVVKGDTSIAYLIRVFGRFWSTDGECNFNHAGIVLAPDGSTFESLSKIDHYNISNYRGKEILIARHKKMSKSRFGKGWESIKHLDGVSYPWWRLGLHLFHLARFFNRSGIPVCSELVGMFENACGLRETYWGLSPDNLADEWRISKYYDIVFDGVL